MADDSEITTLTHYIPVDVFLGMIESDIKKLIHEYGHKNCGLRQEELCEEIKEIIPEKKKIIFPHMNALGQQKWSREWSKQRSKYFSKLYDEEGFINMCFPKTYQNNQRLNQLLSKHIEFCKEKDKRLSDLQKKYEFSVCEQYNMWIDTQRTSFTREYLKNVQKFNSQTVHKYFSTKEHPGGHDPLETYRNIKLDCNLYKSPSKNHQQKQVDNTPTRSLHLPTSSDVGQESQRKGGKSMSDEKGKKEITKPNVKQPPQTEPSSSDSQTPSLANTKLEDNANGQLDDLKAKGTGLTNNAQYINSC
ncbi:hypothetical protein POVWA1_066080 [Plasmodium ovale wallikeri]|uniref:STP1 protein n=1 Tax=Plasmodium ovale wallikeri TaxID=864142 RepID=A0A1A9ADL7_PLAOA|nr:hypothetical protein POVWA1_066080 [Plasmodium ovale wallikeri]